MPYATVDELAGALRIRVTAENTAGLEACLEAAAIEIDHEIAAPAEEPAPPVEGEPPNALANRVNIARAVEWYKAQDAAFGVIGMAETGALTAPRDGFNRHAYALTPIKRRWGIA